MSTRYIDLTNDGPERGGLDPGVPQMLGSLQVCGRLHIGHTADLDDPESPIWWDPRTDVYPGTFHVDMRCPGCVSKIAIGPYGPDATMAAVGHQRGCRWLAEMLRNSGINPAASVSEIKKTGAQR